MQVGEHIAVFWFENNTKIWYLGLVEKVNDDSAYIAYIKTDWIFPDEADIQIIEDDEILKRHITVIYLQSEHIGCQIDKNVVKDVENELQKV